MSQIIRNHKLGLATALVVLAGLGWVAFGFFGVQLLVVDDEVDEAPPAFAADAPTTAGSTPPRSLPIVPPAASAPSAVPTVPAPTSVATPSSTAVAPAPATPPSLPPVTVAPEIVTEHSGSFISRNHPTSGSALVLGNGTGERFLRFESFETDNGPDLNVYLVNSSAGGVDDFVDLGDLKGNLGDQNYEIPVGVDLDVYDTVLIWCVRFASAFGEATLAPA